MSEKIVRINDKNRITIPLDALKDLGISTGDYVLIRWDKRKMSIMPVDIVTEMTLLYKNEPR